MRKTWFARLAEVTRIGCSRPPITPELLAESFRHAHAAKSFVQELAYLVSGTAQGPFFVLGGTPTAGARPRDPFSPPSLNPKPEAALCCGPKKFRAGPCLSATRPKVVPRASWNRSPPCKLEAWEDLEIRESRTSQNDFASAELLMRNY